jgi:hypothetical protein
MTADSATPLAVHYSANVSYHDNVSQLYLEKD